jgi:phytoene/squalene synthetase
MYAKNRRRGRASCLAPAPTRVCINELKAKTRVGAGAKRRQSPDYNPHMTTTPVINRALESAAFRAVRAKCRTEEPDVAFTSYFLSAASRHSLFCVWGVTEQLRQIMGDGKPAALAPPAAPTAIEQPTEPVQPAACGSGGCGSCGGAESPEQRRDVCVAVLDHLYSGEPTGKPELDGFFTVVTRQQIHRELFEQFIAGLYTWNTTRRCATWTKLHQLCDNTGGVGAVIAFKAMLPASAGSQLTPKSQSLISAWGSSMRLIWALEHVGVDKRAGRQLLPMDDLVKFGVLESSLNAWAQAGTANGDAKWRELIAFECTRAENLYRGGVGAFTMLDNRDQKSAAVWGELWCEKLAHLRNGEADGLAMHVADSSSFWRRIKRLPAALRRLMDEQEK